MHPLSEHRLIGRTIKSVSDQRVRLGASPLTQTGSDARTLDQRVLPGQAQPQQMNRTITPGVNAPRATGGMVSSGLTNPVYFGATPENPMGTGEISHYNSKMVPGPTVPFVPAPVVRAPQMNQGSALRASGANIPLPAQNPANPANPAAPAQSLNNFANGAENMSRNVMERMNNRLDKQAFIEEQRVAGKSDAEIKQMLKKMPPDAPQAAPDATPAPAPTTTAPDATATPAPDATKTPEQKGTTATGKDVGKQAGTQGTPAQINPNANALRLLAARVEDPIMQVSLLLQADQADLALSTNPDLTRSEFEAGADGQAIAKPFDAIDTILARSDARAKETFQAQEAFLKGQFERSEKLNAQKEVSIQSQLQFANDKAARAQKDANRKFLDSQTIMLALGGGYGSADGNGEIAVARLKGEEAIIALNKEFGFKRTDVSLQFTEMHNQAFDSYQQAWLTATDNFETKVSNLDLQGISNLQAKSSALAGAHKEYRTEIRDGQKESTKIISDATKMVYDVITSEKEFKVEMEKVENEREWRRFVFQDEKAFRDAQFKESTRQFNVSSESSSNEDVIRQAERQAVRDDRLMAKRNDNIGKLAGQVEKREEVKQYRAVETNYENMTRAWAEAQTSGNLVAADQALIMAWNKILDSQSVVREAEYDRTGKDTPLTNKIGGMLNRIQRGGVRMTNDDRTAIKEMGDLLWEGYQKRMGQVAEDFIPRLQLYNQGLSEEYQIDLEDIGLPSVFGQSDTDKLDQSNQDDDKDSDGNPFTGGGGSAVTLEEYTSQIRGTVTQGFSKPVGYIPGRDIHGGYDIAASRGSPVRAFAGGEVVETIRDPNPGQKKGWGNQVWVKDGNDIYWRYTHLDGFAVKPGDRIQQGVNVGPMGNTGFSTGPHVHVEARRGTKTGPLVDFNKKHLASNSH